MHVFPKPPNTHRRLEQKANRPSKQSKQQGHTRPIKDSYRVPQTKGFFFILEIFLRRGWRVGEVEFPFFQAAVGASRLLAARAHLSALTLETTHTLLAPLGSHSGCKREEQKKVLVEQLLPEKT